MSQPGSQGYGGDARSSRRVEHAADETSPKVCHFLTEQKTSAKTWISAQNPDEFASDALVDASADRSVCLVAAYLFVFPSLRSGRLALLRTSKSRDRELGEAVAARLTDM